VQIEVIQKLADKLQVDPTNVIRIAIARLAELEGITVTQKK
jgi:hypothetical protein